MEGQNVIVSLLGPIVGSSTGTPVTDAYRSIFPAMKKSGVKRIIAMGTASIVDPEDKFSIWAWLAVSAISLFANAAYKEILSIGKVFETEATEHGLDWTIFRLGILGNGAPKGAKAGYVGKGGWTIWNQRADIADWLVEEAEKDDSKWIGKTPAIWS